MSGWAFFIAENAVLSENRTWLIQTLGDANYHTTYGLFSTIATASIAYAYYKLTRGKIVSTAAIPVPRLVAGWMSMSLGLILASQVLPQLQIPVDSKMNVRCPFDFTEKREDGQISGLERVSRHSGLWSFGLCGLGPALTSYSGPLAFWWCGPATVALLGGGHTDSRFRRGMGGQLDPLFESQTSNVPFAAILTGKQGPVGEALHQALVDLKPLNAAIATGIATIWALRRGRIR
jgi:uncharacterized membrane protein